jgi:hypothetical protein
VGARFRSCALPALFLGMEGQRRKCMLLIPRPIPALVAPFVGRVGPLDLDINRQYKGRYVDCQGVNYVCIVASAAAEREFGETCLEQTSSSCN